MKACVKCGAVDRYKSGECRPCAQRKSAERYANPQKRRYQLDYQQLPKIKEKRKYQKAAWDQSFKGWATHMWYAAKQRAKDRKIPFTLDREHLSKLLKKGSCPICGQEMRRNKRHGSKVNSPSLDRMVPGDGYTNTNVIVICHRCNTMKQAIPLSELPELLSKQSRAWRRVRKRLTRKR